MAICPNCKEELDQEGLEFEIGLVLECEDCDHQLEVLTMKDDGTIEFQDNGYNGPDYEEDLEDDVTDEEDEGDGGDLDTD